MLNNDETNLKGILESILKINDYLKPHQNVSQLFEDQKSFDAILMNFVVIGDMVERLSDEFLSKYHYLEWAKIKGFRNLIAHDYFGVDAEEVWQIAKTHLQQLKSDIQTILLQA